MKKLIVICLLVLSVNAGAEWTRLTYTSESVFYVDASSIRKKGDFVKMWVMYDYYKPQTHYNKIYLSVKLQEEFDCKEEQSKVLYATEFTGQMGGGTITNTYPYGDSTWTPVSPGSVGEYIFNIACNKPK